MIGGDFAGRQWADVQQQVAIAGHTLHQHRQTLVKRAGAAIGPIRPTAAVRTMRHRHTRFPRSFALEISDPLLGRIKVSLDQRRELGRRLVVGRANEPRCAVVDQQARLQPVHHVVQLLKAVIAPVAGHVIEPHHVDTPVIAEQFADLFAIERIVLSVVTDEVSGVRPVAGRIIPAQFQAVSMSGIRDLSTDVPLEGSGLDAVFRSLLRVPERESVVVLGDEYDVLHAG